MRLMWGRREGGPTSNVFAYGVEIKRLFSLMVLRFSSGSREAFHSHAFHALSWVLSGRLEEHRFVDRDARGTTWCNVRGYEPSLCPVLTTRSNLHKVYSQPWPHRYTWVLSFRGPWTKTWTELRNNGTERVLLTNGRRELARA